MNYEEKLLKYLVENFRKSKKDAGINKNNRRTQVKPEKLYKKYNANDGDFGEITALNHAVEKLAQKGFVKSTAENFGTQLHTIYLVDERISEIEEYLGTKYGYVSKDAQLLKLKGIVNLYRDASNICSKECEVLQEKIDKRQLPSNIEEIDDIFKMIAFIEHNKEIIYIREASMQVYGDSKYFENNTVQNVCSLLRKYSNKEVVQEELYDEILQDYHIYKEPQKLCIKGKAIITISGKTVDISGFVDGIEFCASEIEKIESVKLMTNAFMTIENRTSYLRFNKDDFVTFYLGGYSNRYQRDFIKLIYKNNYDKSYYHFGDIDAGGFWIHSNLCNVTGVPFNLFSMSIKELENPEYKECLHKLKENDVTRLEELRNNPKYTEVVDYMLKNNVKLEQEIVSLCLMNKK